MMSAPVTRPARPTPPAVSVVLPTYRRAEFLGRAIDSVVRQTREDWELLVVDDNGVGSPDQRATEALMTRYASDARISYLPHGRNLGACAARNTGIRRARGPLVAFLDDDDEWYPHKLARQLEHFASASPEVALVYSGVVVVEPDGRKAPKPASAAARERRNLLKRNGIGTTSAIMCRREALLAVGGFDERLPSMQDYDLYVRLAQRFSFDLVEEPLLEYHRHALFKIGKDHEAAARANCLFYEKHRSLFEGDPEVHHERLRVYGLEVMRAGRLGEARRLLLRAWRAKPSEIGTLALAVVLSGPTLAAYRAMRRYRQGNRRGTLNAG